MILSLSGCIDNSGKNSTSLENESLAEDGDVQEQVKAPESSYVAGKASVEKVMIIMTRSIPPQVRAVASGVLGGSCENIDSENITVTREGNVFFVDLPTLIQNGVPCTRNLVPFEEYIPIDIEGLEPGEYTVSVNGINASFVLGDYSVPSKTYGTIQGNILLESQKAPVENATVYIRLEDVSLADAPSTVIAETSIMDVSPTPGNANSVPFTLGFPKLADNRSYSLYVHVDTDGDGRVSKGDYVTTWYNGVSGGQKKVQMDVTVSPV